ncbi:mucoidy inhibitor MuiA family protein [uncultured Aquimarina sp.]|uniref:mucoidy inhibitor MuiA family protein n=1 Tax=uncultured Aquimarina sp. TaxID=575652 RepID=UPI00261D9EA5|nr:mucoidy inhibitor MuiA family protein [uncultured Aquimarina sp.]
MRIFTLLIVLLPTIIFGNNEKRVSSTIKEVTVYVSGARIQRTALTDILPGVNEIIFYDLSNKIDENSIQISGLKNASILSINYGINYLEKKKNSKELESLEHQLEQLLLQKNNLENLLSGLNQEKKVLENNQQIGSGQTALSLDKVKQISTYYRERSVAIENETYNINLQKNKLHNEIRSITNQIDRLSDHTKEERGEIKVKINVSTATNLALKLKYNVSDAGWFPLYDIKSKNTDTPLKITYKANVYQKTGSDWNNTKVILSTGDPNTNNIRPDLTTRYLNFSYGNYKKRSAVNRYSSTYNPNIKTVSGIITDEKGLPLPGVNVVEKGSSNGAVTDFDGRYTIPIQQGKQLSFSYLGYTTEEITIGSSVVNLSLEEDSSALEEVVITAYGTSSGYRKAPRKKTKRKKEAYNVTVEAKEEGITNTRFVIKKKYTIKSNSDITTIEIDNFDMNADYSYYVAPELNENVFLTAKLGNWEQFDLLAGEANIYFEGSYAGKTNIDPQATTDSLMISLGTDPNIVVKREPLKNFKSKSFYGSNRIVDLGYSIQLKNNKQNTIHLILEDRIPISQNKEIKVDNIETNEANYDPKTGIIKWKLTVKPKAQLEKHFSYQLKYPKNKRVNL